MIVRNAEALRVEKLTFYLTCIPPTAEVASYYFEQEQNGAIEADLTCYLPKNWDNLYDELFRRDEKKAKIVDEYIEETVS